MKNPNSPNALIFRRFCRNKLAVVGFFVLVGMFLFSFLGPIFSPYGEYALFFMKDGVETQIGFLSGLSDEIKADAWAMRHRCIEVAAMEVLPTGGIRHGKLKQFRPDLTYLDCTWEKAFG